MSHSIDEASLFNTFSMFKTFQQEQCRKCPFGDKCKTVDKCANYVIDATKGFRAIRYKETDQKYPMYFHLYEFAMFLFQETTNNRTCWETTT